MPHDTEIDILTPLRGDNTYVRSAATTIYWSIAPYLIEQRTESSCSLATATMIVNAIRGIEGQSRLGDLATERGLLDRVQDEAWRDAVQPEGGGLTILQFADYMTKSLMSYGLAWSATPREIEDVETAATEFRNALNSMESARPHFISVNFHLDRLYGDGVDIGHFSPLGGYDAARDRVLILDVYKPYYEPMWAPVDRLLAAMAVPQISTGAKRGYAIVRKE